MKISSGLPNRPKKAEQERHPLADRSRDFGGSHVAEPARQQRAQHSPAVHRKGGDQVEHREEQVDDGKPVDHPDVLRVKRGEVIGTEMGTADHDQKQSDDDVDCGARDSNQKFLTGLFRNALEPRHASNRQQDHVRRTDPESACREDVPELVEKDTEEKKDHENQAAPGRLCASRKVVDAEYPGEKQQEGHMDADRRAGDRSDLHGPAHHYLPKAPIVRNLAPRCIVW